MAYVGHAAAGDAAHNDGDPDARDCAVTYDRNGREEVRRLPMGGSSARAGPDSAPQRRPFRHQGRPRSRSQ